MRRVDDTRKQAREAVSARKAEQKLEKMRELERLNALKKQEILDKIAYIRKVAGTDDNFDLSALDLESDYDPEKHVSKMNKVFNEAFYEDTVSTAAYSQPALRPRYGACRHMSTQLTCRYLLANLLLECRC